MPTLYKIELQPATADQWLTTELDGNPYRLRVLWNERGGYFALSLYTLADTPILQNVKMVKNYELIQRFADSRLPTGGMYFVQENGSALRPSFDDLATTHYLYYLQPDAEAQPVPVQLTVSADAQIGSIWDSDLSTWDSGSSTWDM